MAQRLVRAKRKIALARMSVFPRGPSGSTGPRQCCTWCTWSSTRGTSPARSSAPGPSAGCGDAAVVLAAAHPAPGRGRGDRPGRAADPARRTARCTRPNQARPAACRSPSRTVRCGTTTGSPRRADAGGAGTANRTGRRGARSRPPSPRCTRRRRRTRRPTGREIVALYGLLEQAVPGPVTAKPGGGRRGDARRPGGQGWTRGGPDRRVRRARRQPPGARGPPDGGARRARRRPAPRTTGRSTWRRAVPRDYLLAPGPARPRGGSTQTERHRDLDRQVLAAGTMGTARSALDAIGYP